MSLSAFRSRFLALALDLHWDQWVALGLSGSGRSMPFAIDPEALVLSTCRFGRYDPRLFDGMLTWLLHYGDWISLTRLRRMASSSSAEEKRILFAIARTIAERRRIAKWRTLLRQGPSGPMTDTPLFLRPEGKALPHASPPDTDCPLLRLRLRGLFGVSLRAEVVLYLLTHRRGHPRLLARKLHYAQPGVSRVLAELRDSGMVLERIHGKQHEYALEVARWQTFLALQRVPHWLNWAPLFMALWRTWQETSALEAATPSAALTGSTLRRLAVTISRDVEDSELDFDFPRARPGQVEEYVDVFAQAALDLVRQVREPREGATPAALETPRGRAVPGSNASRRR